VTIEAFEIHENAPDLGVACEVIIGRYLLFLSNKGGRGAYDEALVGDYVVETSEFEGTRREREGRPDAVYRQQRVGFATGTPGGFQIGEACVCHGDMWYLQGGNGNRSSGYQPRNRRLSLGRSQPELDWILSG